MAEGLHATIIIATSRSHVSLGLGWMSHSFCIARGDGVANLIISLLILHSPQSEESIIFELFDRLDPRYFTYRIKLAVVVVGPQCGLINLINPPLYMRV